jgi:heme-degrading monooxygenase HmoA
MHARVVTCQIQLDKMDEVVAITQDSVMPAAKQQTGLKHFLALADRSTGKGLVITLWETEADMMASDEATEYYQEQAAKVMPLLDGSLTAENYEVTVWE